MQSLEDNRNLFCTCSCIGTSKGKKSVFQSVCYKMCFMIMNNWIYGESFVYNIVCQVFFIQSYLSLPAVEQPVS